MLPIQFDFMSSYLLFLEIFSLPIICYYFRQKRLKPVVTGLPETEQGLKVREVYVF